MIITATCARRAWNWRSFSSTTTCPRWMSGAVGSIPSLTRSGCPAGKAPLELAGGQHVDRPEGQAGDRLLPPRGRIAASAPMLDSRVARGRTEAQVGRQAANCIRATIVAPDGACSVRRPRRSQPNPGLISSMSSSKDNNGDDPIEPEATAGDRSGPAKRPVAAPTTDAEPTPAADEPRPDPPRAPANRERAEPQGAGQGGGPRARRGAQAQARGAQGREARRRQGRSASVSAGCAAATAGDDRRSRRPSRSRG